MLEDHMTHAVPARAVHTAQPSAMDQLHSVRPISPSLQLVACIDSRRSAAAVAAHAAAIAPCLGLSPVMATVIDSAAGDGPSDPISWHARQTQQEKELRRLGREVGFGTGCRIVTETGCPHDTLPRIVQRVGASLVVAAKRDDPRLPGLGATATNLLERTDGALLLVSPEDTPAKVRYRRILVPIDGSARADSALPVAQRIAREHDAELWLVHVLPLLTVVDEQRSPHMRDLRNTLNDHNRRNLERHMRALQVQLPRSGTKARVQIAGPGDPRLILRHLLDTEGADLVVMTSHGTTGIESLSCGSVAQFLIGQPKVPVLVLRPGFHCENWFPLAPGRSVQSAFSFN